MLTDNRIGTEAGIKGGNLLFSGTPGEIMKIDCPTGNSLRNYLKNFE